MLPRLLPCSPLSGDRQMDACWSALPSGEVMGLLTDEELEELDDDVVWQCEEDPGSSDCTQCSAGIHDGNDNSCCWFHCSACHGECPKPKTLKVKAPDRPVDPPHLQEKKAMRIRQ